MESKQANKGRKKPRFFLQAIKRFAWHLSSAPAKGAVNGVGNLQPYAARRPINSSSSMSGPYRRARSASVMILQLVGHSRGCSGRLCVFSARI
jgi:hypothetical protein